MRRKAAGHLEQAAPDPHLARPGLDVEGSEDRAPAEELKRGCAHHHALIAPRKEHDPLAQAGEALAPIEALWERGEQGCATPVRRERGERFAKQRAQASMVG